MEENKRGYNKKTIIVMCLILIQAVVVLVIAQWSHAILWMSSRPSIKTVSQFALFSGIFVGCSTVFLFVQMVRLANKERDYEVNKAVTEQNKDLIDVLRASRHDFSNHLQVIMGFIQLGKNDMALEYMNEITGKMEAQSFVSNIKNLGIAALILKKQSAAELRGISFKTDIKTDLHNLSVNPSELARILGNLIDNAFDATMESSSNPEVTVALDKDDYCYNISVTNTGPIISEEIQSRIFGKGFTTKGSSGSGLGLYIVRELTEKNKGTVMLRSNPEEGTIFIVQFPID